MRDNIYIATCRGERIVVVTTSAAKAHAVAMEFFSKKRKTHNYSIAITKPLVIQDEN